MHSTTRPAVVAAARAWIGTPYHPCADIHGVGVDCGMLIVRVFVDAGVCPPFDPRPYPPDWHLHRGEERYLGFVYASAPRPSRPSPATSSPSASGAVMRTAASSPRVSL